MTNQNSPHTSARLGELILVRLLAAGKKPPARSDLNKLERYFAGPVGITADKWKELLNGALAALQEDGWIEAKPFRLTDQGRARALGFLSVESVPGNLNWKSLRNRYLIAKALGIKPQSKAEWKRLGSAEGVRAAALTKHYQLPISPVPTLAQALNALAWFQFSRHQEKALPFEKPFNRKTLLGITLLDGRPSENPEEELVVRATSASSQHADKVRDALISTWIHGDGSSAVDTSNFDLQSFAARVCELACNTGTGRYGDHKVFISHVWNRFCREHFGQRMTRDEFNRRLVEANREELLTLSRADLVSAMAPEDVQQSEIRLPHSSFHFIRTDRQTR
jgi:hypothetical protein